MTRPFAAIRCATTTTDAGQPTLHTASFTVDLTTKKVHRNDIEVHLTPTEFDLLSWLATHPGAVATREQLLHQVWGYRDGSGARTVDSHVRSLRRKLGAGIVRTVHGVGYAFRDGEPR